MAKTFVFVNQKGGVGKTTSAINIGAYIALAKKKVLLVDFDSQGNMSSGVGVSKDKPTIYELLSGECEAAEAVKKTSIPTLDAISASLDLSGAAIELVDQERREYFLKDALEPLQEKYDYILIDCPPSLGRGLSSDAMRIFRLGRNHAFASNRKKSPKVYQSQFDNRRNIFHDVRLAHKIGAGRCRSSEVIL